MAISHRDDLIEGLLTERQKATERIAELERENEALRVEYNADQQRMENLECENEALREEVKTTRNRNHGSV